MKVLLVDADPGLGGVCTNRGCIPSKSLLHIAKLIHEAREAEAWASVSRRRRSTSTSCAATCRPKSSASSITASPCFAKGRGVEVIKGTRASFIDSNTVKLEGETTGTIRFEKCIISTGSIPTMPKAFTLGDPRVMDSTVRPRPARRAQTNADRRRRLHRPGNRHCLCRAWDQIVVVEFTDGLLPTADRDLVRPLEKILREQFEAIHLNTKVASLKATPQGIVAMLEGKDVPPSETFDRVLISVGRRPEQPGWASTKPRSNSTNAATSKWTPSAARASRTFSPSATSAGEPGLRTRPPPKRKRPSRRCWANGPSLRRERFPPSFSPTPNSPGPA